MGLVSKCDVVERDADVVMLSRKPCYFTTPFCGAKYESRYVNVAALGTGTM